MRRRVAGRAASSRPLLPPRVTDAEDREHLKDLIKRRLPFLVPPLKRAPDMVRSALRAMSVTVGRLPLVGAWWKAVLGRRRRVVFEKIFHANTWVDRESRSGVGSNFVRTEVIRQALAEVIADYGIRSMLDIPCGDFFWMRLVDLDVDYVGADIVPVIVEQNQAQFGSERRRFVRLDLVRDQLPRVDLVFCRDGLVHLSHADALSAVKSIKGSGSKFLFATTFTAGTSNRDIDTGNWRALNLRLSPFRFPEPLVVIYEREPQEDFRDKSMGLWRVADLP